MRLVTNNSTSVSANSPEMRTERHRVLTCPPERPPAASAVLRLMRDPVNAGTRPKSVVTPMPITTANTNTVASMLTCEANGEVAGISVLMPCIVA